MKAPFGASSLRDRYPLFSIVEGMTFALVELLDLESLGKATKSFDDPTEFDEGWADAFRGTKYYVDQGKDENGKWLFRTRMHGAAECPVEDAATGSASCALACYLALYHRSIAAAPGPFEFHIVQGVEMGRESHIFVHVERTSDGKGIERVGLSGSAVKVMDGVIEVE